MRTKKYHSKKNIKKKSSSTKRRYMKGGDYPLDQLRQIPPQDYIPYGGDIIGDFDYPEPAKNAPDSVIDFYLRGGRKSKNKKRSAHKKRTAHYKKRTAHYKKHKKIRGGNLTSIIPQQALNASRGVSSFFMDKVNGYEGYPEQPSYLPYNQPINNMNDVELIKYF